MDFLYEQHATPSSPRKKSFFDHFAELGELMEKKSSVGSLMNAIIVGECIPRPPDFVLMWISNECLFIAM